MRVNSLNIDGMRVNPLNINDMRENSLNINEMRVNSLNKILLTMLSAIFPVLISDQTCLKPGKQKSIFSISVCTPTINLPSSLFEFLQC